MEPARRGEGTRSSRVSSDSASSSIELDGNKELYVFVWHHVAQDYCYSLFALDIPSPGTVVELETTKTTVTTTTETAADGEFVTTSTSEKTEPKRSPLTPVLRFPRKEEWPLFMRCIRLDSKLYFLAGQELGGRGFPTDVHVLDLSQELPKRDGARKVLKQVASMNTGKSHPIVSFVADGKLFLVSGIKKCSVTGAHLTQFEIFNPSVGEWKEPQHQPPFKEAVHLSPPFVVGRTVYFAGTSIRHGDFTCLYDIDTAIWSDYCPMDVFGCSVADMVLGGEVVGETTLWNVCDHPKTKEPVVVRLDITMDKKKPKDKKFFYDALRYCIRDLEFNDGENPPADRRLTRLAKDSRRLSSRLCFLQVECHDGLVGGQIAMSATLFDVHGIPGRHSAKYLTSAHYFVQDLSVNPYTLMDAHLV